MIPEFPSTFDPDPDCLLPQPLGEMDLGERDSGALEWIQLIGRELIG
jgi:hypothetical protein